MSCHGNKFTDGFKIKHSHFFLDLFDYEWAVWALLFAFKYYRQSEKEKEIKYWLISVAGQNITKPMRVITRNGNLGG